jgi:hypothetical protein
MPRRRLHVPCCVPPQGRDMSPAPEEIFEAARANDRDRIERLLAAGAERLRAQSEKLGGGTPHA